MTPTLVSSTSNWRTIRTDRDLALMSKFINNNAICKLETNRVATQQERSKLAIQGVSPLLSRISRFYLYDPDCTERVSS